MKIAFAICIAGLLSSCGAAMISQPGMATKSSYAPINERSRGGVIKYSIAGMQSITQSNREDAYRQMSKACNGSYYITHESDRNEGAVATYWGYGIATSQPLQMWYIHFNCV